ncbi:hypothetical protein C3B55_00706 [Candidatus Pseudomonas adelgestsugas]|uniref:Uncharacterized protein n=1 Tax=Candidatus Pseudomonas adelgestsugas TaxID=1302376 RepID=A0ABX5R8Y9_9PSED|nr:hypothetical protein C3B55_00706 [Candidatus Pseudomonas adelgestsugas]
MLGVFIKILCILRMSFPLYYLNRYFYNKLLTYKEQNMRWSYSLAQLFLCIPILLAAFAAKATPEDDP